MSDSLSVLVTALIVIGVGAISFVLEGDSQGDERLFGYGAKWGCVVVAPVLLELAIITAVF